MGDYVFLEGITFKRDRYIWEAQKTESEVRGTLRDYGESWAFGLSIKFATIVGEST